MEITPAALRVIERISQDSPFKVSVHGSMILGYHLDLIANSEPLPNDVTICTDPWVIADLPAITYLMNRTLDCTNDEFVINL